MVNQTQFYKSPACNAVESALMGSYFYSDKKEGAGEVIEQDHGT